MTADNSGNDPLEGVALNRRQLIQRIIVGSAFALPVVASFDMASLGVSTASANSPNQLPLTPSFESADTAVFTVGTLSAFGVITPGAAPVKVAETGTLPAGVVFQPALDNYAQDNDLGGTLQGTPAAGTGGVYPLSLTASNGFLPNAVQSFKLYVNEAPAFTSAANVTLHVGKEAHFTVTTSGYPDAIVVNEGNLPKGLKVDYEWSKGAALITGKPKKAGTFKVKFLADNGVGKVISQTLTLKIEK